ncbi:gp53-like domain-containing protein [Pseudoduganella violaceinigra]|uniref:gp53-like domain-containing protein n=1 Tax=Pseudoduganella violaceinigra TaxID=246602 RepID=UPI0005530C60|nr:hypothetical protein [Pseudoduganella violaceinigra]
MKRITTATKSVDKFGAGKHGFTNGNAVAGIPATDLEDTWFDHVQEELCTVVEAAGLALDGSSRAQLLAALRSAGVFQTQAVGDQSAKAATTAFVNQGHSLLANGYQKLPSGLLIQWGSVVTSVSGDVAVTFPVAFPAACRSITFGHLSMSSFGGVGSNGSSTTGFICAGYNPSGRVSIDSRWMAIGH